MSQDTTQGGAAVHDGPGSNPDHTAKKTTIIVNARQYEVAGDEISYEQIVNLAYNNAPPTGENVVITVTYSRGEHDREGTMLPGDRVKLKTKMVFDVSATDRS